MIGLNSAISPESLSSAFGEDERVVAFLQNARDVAQRLTQTSRALDGNERREIVHISAFVFRVEPVISRRDRDGLFRHVFAESFFDQARVEMRSVIRRDDKIGVHRNICFAFDLRVENSFIQSFLREIHERISDAANDRRNVNFFVVFFLGDFRFVGEFFRFINSLNGGQKFANTTALRSKCRAKERDRPRLRLPLAVRRTSRSQNQDRRVCRIKRLPIKRGWKPSPRSCESTKPCRRLSFQRCGWFSFSRVLRDFAETRRLRDVSLCALPCAEVQTVSDAKLLPV